MKQRLLYILLMITTALSWSLEARAQTTYYVFENLEEQKKTSPNKIDYTLSTDQPFHELSFDCKWSKVAPWPYYGNNNPVYVEWSSDNKNWTEIYKTSIPDENTWYDFKVVLPKETKYIRFEAKTGATGARHIRNVKVTRATTLTSTTTSLDFGTINRSTNPTGTISKTIKVDYNNTYSDAKLTGTCPAGFSVTETSMGETGTGKEITVTYNPTEPGQHGGKITLSMGTAGKNNNVEYQFDVSGTCELDYTFAASANTNNSSYGTAKVTLDRTTKENGEEATATVTSSNSSETKELTFKAEPKAGYYFAGWYDNSDCTGDPVDNNATYSASITSTSSNTSSSKTLYAKFELVSYSVAFHGNGSTGGEAMSNQTFNYFENKALSTNTYERAYTVSYSDGVAQQTADATFMGWARSADATENVYSNEQTVQNLTSDNGTVINLYAVWQLKSITLPSAVKAGYTFDGWYDGEERIGTTGDSYTPEEDKNLTAHWTASAFTVTLNHNGGAEGTESVSATYGAAMPSGKTAPTRTGYTFAGYFDAADGGTEYYHADMTSAKAWDKADDATLYAHWTPNTYEVVFNGNGNTGGSMSNQSFNYDEEKTLTANAFTRQYTITFNTDGGDAMSEATVDYTFGGWATSASGDATYEDKESVSNLATSGNYTLYAVWSTDYKLPLPTKAGYNFAGWSDGTNTGMQNGTSYTPTGNVTLTAEWTQDLLSPTLQKNYEDAQAAMRVGGNIDNAFTLSNVSADLEIRIVNTPVVEGQEVISCTNANGKATITALNAGTATLQFHQPATGTIAEATSSVYTFTVTKNTGTISSLLPGTIGITNELSLSQIASYNKGGITDDVNVTINVSSNNENVLKFEGGKLKALALGTATITLSQAENYKYTATNVEVSVEVVRNNDVVTWTEGKDYTLAANTSHDLSSYATSENGQTVKYALMGEHDAEVATLDGNNLLTPIKAGTVTLKAYTEESDNYNAAECTTTQIITIEKATPVVNWKTGISSSIDMEALSTLDINGYATATTGATMTYATSQAEIVSIEGNVLTAHKSGTVTLTASVAATDIYNAASNTLTITVTKIPAKIVWNQILPALTDKTTGSIPLTAVVVAQNDESKTDAGANIIYTSSANNVVSIASNNMTVTGQGSATVTASFAGDDVFDAATSVNKDVNVTGYNVTSTWVNDASPANGASFYIQSVQTSNFMRGGQAELTTDAKTASLWNLEATGSAFYVSTNVSGTTYYLHMESDGCNTNTTTKDPTSWGIHQNQITFTLVSSGEYAPYYRLHNGNYHAYNSSGTSIKTDNNGNNTSSQWYLISTDQYNYRLTDIPTAVSKYLYGEGTGNEKYNRVIGKTRQNLVDATKLNSNFAAARTTIAAAMQAFDDYLVELDKIEAFQASIAANTPDVTAAQTDVDNAIAALQGANGSTAIKAVYANNIKRKFTTLSATYPTLLPKASAGNVNGIVMSGEDEVDATITYVSNNTTILTVSATGEIQPLKEGRTTITLTTATTDDYYAAIPFTTEEIEVTDRLTLNNATAANYTPGEYGTVVLERTLKAGYSTIALPFDYELSDLNADWAAQLSVVTYNAQDGYSLYFNKITEGTLNANEPYIIHVTTQKENPQFSDVNVSAASATEKQATGGVNADGHSYTDWAMHSNYTPNFNMEGKYGVVNREGVLMLGGTGATLSAFGAYITGPANSQARVRAAYLDGKETDGLLEVLIQGERDEERIYDLTGRQHSQTQRGVNIIRHKDGTTKKVLKK